MLIFCVVLLATTLLKIKIYFIETHLFYLNIDEYYCYVIRRSSEENTIDKTKFSISIC